MSSEFGILTLARERDYKKAVGLALSARMTNPEVPICIVCSKKIASKIGQFFDDVVIEKDNIKGFKHKLFLDHYSPYTKIFFFDADILIFKDLTPILKDWEGCVYGVLGRFSHTGCSAFGMNREYVLSRIGKRKFVDISGAGHAYFEKPACSKLFDLAREITNNYSQYANPCRFADEDVMGIALTILNMPPMETTGFLGMPWHAKKGTIEIDITKGKCIYIDKRYGWREPYIFHFPRLGFPFLYARELSKLFRMHDINIKGLWRDAVIQKWTTDVWWKLLNFRKKII